MRLLLTGASGLFGANALLQYAGRFEVVAVAHQHPLTLPKSGTVPGPEPSLCASVVCDLTDAAAVQALLQRHRPQVVLHAAAMTNVDGCEEQPAQAQALNVEASMHVAEAAQAVGASLVALSTDYVFDGAKPGGRYAEEDPPRPLGVYARTKLAGEQAALSRCRRATIVRTTLYGWNAQPKQSFAERVLEGVSGGPPVTGFTDMYWSPILANELAEALVPLIERPTPGLFHVAGRERCSRYEFACAVATAFGHDPRAVRPGRLADAPLKAPRPPDASLEVTKFEQAFGVTLPTVTQGLARMRALRDEGWVDRLKRLLA